MAAVSLFWDTDMAAVTSCENALLGGTFLKTEWVGGPQFSSSGALFSLGTTFLGVG